jgi:hypothetical protein
MIVAYLVIVAYDVVQILLTNWRRRQLRRRDIWR